MPSKAVGETRRGTPVRLVREYQAGIGETSLAPAMRGKMRHSQYDLVIFGLRGERCIWHTPRRPHCCKISRVCHSSFRQVSCTAGGEEDGARGTPLDIPHGYTQQHLLVRRVSECHPCAVGRFTDGSCPCVASTGARGLLAMSSLFARHELSVRYAAVSVICARGCFRVVPGYGGINVELVWSGDNMVQ